MKCSQCNDTGICGDNEQGLEIYCSCEAGSISIGQMRDVDAKNDFLIDALVDEPEFSNRCPGGHPIGDCTFNPSQGKCSKCPHLRVAAIYRR